MLTPFLKPASESCEWKKAYRAISTMNARNARNTAIEFAARKAKPVAKLVKEIPRAMRVNAVAIKFSIVNIYLPGKIRQITYQPDELRGHGSSLTQW